MSVTRRYSLAIDTVNAVAGTNNNNAVTGIAAGGIHFGGARLMTAVGALTALAAGDAVVPVPTVASVQNGPVPDSFVYDLVFTGQGAINNLPHDIVIPQTMLRLNNQTVILGIVPLGLVNTVTTNIRTLPTDLVVIADNVNDVLRISFGLAAGTTLPVYLAANTALRLLIYKSPVGN